MRRNQTYRVSIHVLLIHIRQNAQSFTWQNDVRNRALISRQVSLWDSKYTNIGWRRILIQFTGGRNNGRGLAESWMAEEVWMPRAVDSGLNGHIRSHAQVYNTCYTAGRTHHSKHIIGSKIPSKKSTCFPQRATRTICSFRKVIN